MSELQTQVEAIVQQVRATGQPVDIVQDGVVAARITPTTRVSATSTASPEERRQAVSAWLRTMDGLADELGELWPKGVSAQDVVDDVRGAW